MRRVMIVALALAPASARAGNGLDPREVPEWPADTPCITVVDRSQSPLVHFDYTIAAEDTTLTSDEVPDSRRHQFVAFCRNHSPQDFLPTWLSLKDVEAAAMTTPPLIDVMDIPPGDIMEENARWKDCFVRITPDDQRRPTTFAEAAKGVDWDTTGLPAGAYVVEGYTWEPAYNLWSPRPGVFHVVDGPDVSAVPPAAALMNTEDYLFAEQTLMLHGCARAMPGSTLTGYWSLTPVDGLDWKPFAVDVPLDGEAIAMPFEPPIEAVGETITLRVDVTDPMQRTYSAFARQVIGVLPGSGGSGGCSNTGSFIGDDCGSDSSSGGGGGTGESGSTGGGSTGGSSGGSSGGGQETGGPKSDESSGCGCHTGGSGWGLTVVALGLVVRRRKRGSTLGPS